MEGKGPTHADQGLGAGLCSQIMNGLEGSQKVLWDSIPGLWVDGPSLANSINNNHVQNQYFKIFTQKKVFAPAFLKLGVVLLNSNV